MPEEDVMPQKRKFTPLPQRSAKKVHISQASITRLTVSRYTSAMNLFFRWRRARRLCAKPEFAELDLKLGEYLNHLYQNDRPLYLGINCIAGFKKLRPQCKKHIDTAVAWLNNWVKVTVKVQAMPLHTNLVQAFVGYGLLKREYDFALSLYVGFLGLWRGCEILDLHMSDVQARGPDQVVLILRNTKGAQLRNVPFETVTIRDPLAINILLKRKTVGGPMLFNGKRARFAELYKDAVSFSAFLIRSLRRMASGEEGPLGTLRFTGPMTAPSSTGGGPRLSLHVRISMRLPPRSQPWRHVKKANSV